MSKCPLCTILNKDKLFIVHDGKLDIIPSPTVELPLPRSRYKEYNAKTLKKDSHFFIGARKYRPDYDHESTGFEANLNMESVLVEMDHMEWKETYGRGLPFSYTDYMLITRKDILNKYPQTIKPKVMCFDIETCSDGTGLFPIPERNPIAMAGAKIIGADNIHIFKDFDPNDKGSEDRNILKDFINFIESENPDIIVSYNGWTFDMPYILKRMQINAIPYYGLLGVSQEDASKDKNLQSYLSYCASPYNDVQLGNLGRRIHYDIFNVDVLRDQKLMGIKDRKMKTLGKFFFDDKENIIELKENIENIWKMMGSDTGRSELEEYLLSDVKLTERIHNIYFESNNVAQANRLVIPINIMINRRNATIPTMYILEEMFKNKMIPLTPNTTMFDMLINRAETEFKEEKLFQGAYVDIFRRGKHPNPIWKFDFSSLYPSLIRTLNLSYETVQMHFEPMSEPIDTLDSYEFKKGNGFIKITFNDEVLRVRATAIIDTTRRGLVPRILDEVISNRKEVRSKMKDINPESTEYKMLDSFQNFWKVLANSTYGLLSQRTGIGYLPLGMTITAMGRWSTRKVICELNDKQSQLLNPAIPEAQW